MSGLRFLLFFFLFVEIGVDRDFMKKEENNMESNLKRLKDEADIKAVVEALGIPYRRKGANYFMHCPAPDHQDSDPSAYFKAGWNNIYCNSCGRAFRALDVIIWTTGWSIKEASIFLWELEGRPEWFMASKEERSSFSLSPEEARTVGLKPGGEVRCYMSCTDMKEPLGMGERYAPGIISGYLKVRTNRVTWRDFMMEQEFVGLVIRKAAEAAVLYRQHGLTFEAKQAAAVLRRAAGTRQKERLLA